MFAKNTIIKHLILLIALAITGCDQENTVAKKSPANNLSELRAAEKAAAASELQSVIRNARRTSVWHRGFAPKAKPPCPGPDWEPKDVLTVDGNEIRTIYHKQHWINKKESRGGNGYWEYSEWRAYEGIVTKHDFRIRLDDITKVEVEKPFLREWVVVKIFHSKPADVFQAEDSALPRVFEIWFTKSGSKPQSYKRCLAALKTLCPHLKIKH